MQIRPSISEQQFAAILKSAMAVYTAEVPGTTLIYCAETLSGTSSAHDVMKMLTRMACAGGAPDEGERLILGFFEICAGISQEEGEKLMRQYSS